MLAYYNIKNRMSLWLLYQTIGEEAIAHFLLNVFMFVRATSLTS
jgi:hypothetical protein